MGHLGLLDILRMGAHPLIRVIMVEEDKAPVLKVVDGTCEVEAHQCFMAGEDRLGEALLDGRRPEEVHRVEDPFRDMDQLHRYPRLQED